MCQRLDNFLGPSYKSRMLFWEYVDSGEKEVKTKSRVQATVSKVHELFRKKLGYVDQSDVKATVQGLTAEMDPKWYQNQLKFLIESAVSSCHANYNLDSSVAKREAFTEFHNQLLVELLEKSKNYRKYKMKKKRGFPSPAPKSDSRRSHKRHKSSPARHRVEREYGYPTKEGLTCPGRKNLAAFLRRTTKRMTCQFCGKRNKNSYFCVACGGYFCLKAPENITDPLSQPQRNFRIDGPFCWHRYHGYSTFAECSK